MRSGLMAKKMGMTRVFDDNGRHIPVTVLQVEDAQVVATRTMEKDGYTAVQLGAFAQKAQRVNKAQAGQFKKAGVTPKKVIREFRTDAESLPEVGSDMSVEHFQAGQWVDVAGTTIGRGFAGAMKRHGFGGLRASHGVSISHRAHGSTGQCQEPGKVFKGKRMAGQMGNVRRTQQNLQVVKIDADKGVLLIKGSIPGAKGQIVLIKDAVKKAAPAA